MEGNTLRSYSLSAATKVTLTLALRVPRMANLRYARYLTSGVNQFTEYRNCFMNKCNVIQVIIVNNIIVINKKSTEAICAASFWIIFG